MTLSFLMPSPAVTAESPLAQAARRDGATLDIRRGWLVAVRFGAPEFEAEALRTTVAWADLSPLVTTQYAALLLAGPCARETIARFCALDLRNAQPGDRMPGSVARTPGVLCVEAADRYLLLFGAALSEYMWAVVSDAGRSPEGRPAGWDAAMAIRTTAQVQHTTHA